MLVPQKKLLFYLLFLSIESLGQGRLSPKIANQGFKFESSKPSISICVKNSKTFREKYTNKITINHTAAGATCFEIIVLHRSVFDSLKTDPNILFIDQHRRAVVESGLDYSNLSLNRIDKAHQFFPTINGTDYNISVKEQSFDPANIDLINRSFTTSLTPAAISQHATEMAILIGGAGNSSYRAIGVASQARFTSSDFSNLLPDAISIFNANNIHIQNHSYGVEIENYYGNEAFAYDQQVSQNPTLLHIFSAGNSGLSKPLSGIYSNMRFANLSGNFKQAKNVLVVNAVDTSLLLNNFNSRGPAFDGRVKPELTAYGQGGTSDAAALVSGIATLVQEKYRSIYNSLPAASMIKAILIASADDVGPKGIDYLYGYGSVNAFKALRLVELNQLMSVTLTNNLQQSIPINVPPSTSKLHIAISWIDPPPNINATQVLINDIDSWLDDGSANYQPWVLNAFPHPDSLRATAIRKSDHLNNTEYITVDNPAQGSYQLNLKSGILNNGIQQVAVAYWLTERKTFSWDFPLSSSIVEGRKKNLLVWESLPDQRGDLFLQINQGSWQLIKSGIELNNYFYWNPPDTLAASRLKMKIGMEEFVSDDFIISPKPQLKTSFICTDSIALSWNPIKNASGYQLYSLDNKYLKQVGVTNDSLLVRPSSLNPYYAIAPMLNGQVGIKSETINFTQQGSLCFLNLFSATRISATQLKIRLSMSSWYQVEKISIYKTIGGIQSIFKNLTSGKSLQVELFDPQLVPGIMAYQAEITFRNGKKIFSDVAEVVIEEKGRAILYPNPVTANSDLNILSAGGVTFKVLDQLGRLVFEKKLINVEEVVDLINLPTGLYFYQLLSNEGVTDKGRFIKY